jgi:hypothetical protein
LSGQRGVTPDSLRIKSNSLPSEVRLSSSSPRKPQNLAHHSSTTHLLRQCQAIDICIFSLTLEQSHAIGGFAGCSWYASSPCGYTAESGGDMHSDDHVFFRCCSKDDCLAECRFPVQPRSAIYSRCSKKRVLTFRQARDLK